MVPELERIVHGEYVIEHTCPDENVKKHNATAKSEPESSNAIFGPLLKHMSIAALNGFDEAPL